ncbi:MAG: Nif3-like dinuclear metal center hexameric protein [Fluviibacter sp.]|jgi:dinuclear metal center YbgI/SA1388 family protein
MSQVNRDVLTQYLNELLKPEGFKDYCPNGLQVEGREEIRRLVCGVTANQALLDLAIAEQADAILVHHGWFWRGETGVITGIKRNRLKTLLANDINLYAYHLPLDAHPALGNNVGLAKAAGWQQTGVFGEQGLGCIGIPEAPATVATLAANLEKSLGRPPFVLAESLDQPIGRIAWCTGGAQSYFEAAIAAGADAFVTGEVSEPMVHLARETGVAYIAAGHHATERFGVQALGEAIAAHFGIGVRYLDVDSPV